MSFFVILICVSQVYASCQTYISPCPPSFPTESIIGIVIGGIVLGVIGVYIRIIRQRSRQRGVLPAYSIPNNSYGRPQSNILLPPARMQRPPGQQPSRPFSTRMNAVTPSPPFPKPLHLSPGTNPERPPSNPYPTRRPPRDQTPHTSLSSPDPSHLRDGPYQPPPAFSPPNSFPVRVTAAPSSVETPSAIITPAASPPLHPPVATSVARQSPAENMEMHPLREGTGAANDEPPPAYTPM